jgi:hypothetical protein
MSDSQLQQLQKLVSEGKLDISSLISSLQHRESIISAATQATNAVSSQGNKAEATLTLKQPLPTNLDAITAAAVSTAVAAGQSFDVQVINETKEVTGRFNNSTKQIDDAISKFMSFLPNLREKSPSLSLKAEESKSIVERTRFFLKSVINASHNRKNAEGEQVSVKVGFEEYQTSCGITNCSCEQLYNIPHFYYSIRGLPPNFLELTKEQQKSLSEEEKTANTSSTGDSVIWRNEKNKVSYV